MLLLVLASITAIGILIDQWLLPTIVRQSDTITVQSVVRIDFEDAKQRLFDRGLQVMPPIEQFSSTIPMGQVMSQLPYAGANVNPGRRIYLTVSQGLEKIRVPVLEGLSIRDARLALFRTGLLLGNVEFEFNDSIGADKVLRQSTPSGANVTSGTTISVTASRGRSGILVPDVVGLSMSEAERALTESGLVLGTITATNSGTFSPNTVLKQNPVPDSSVAPGTYVHLTIVH